MRGALEPARVRGDPSEQEPVRDGAFGQREEELRVQERLAAGEPDPFDAGLPAGPQELHRRRYRQSGLSPLDRAMGAIQVAVRRGREQDLARRKGLRHRRSSLAIPALPQRFHPGLRQARRARDQRDPDNVSQSPSGENEQRHLSFFADKNVLDMNSLFHLFSRS